MAAAAAARGAAPQLACMRGAVHRYGGVSGKGSWRCRTGWRPLGDVHWRPHLPPSFHGATRVPKDLCTLSLLGKGEPPANLHVFARPLASEAASSAHPEAAVQDPGSTSIDH